MSNIKEFETRIAHALDRIGRATQALRGPAPAHTSEPDGTKTGAKVADERPATPPGQFTTPADAAALIQAQAALDAERAKNVQLTERVNAVRQRQDTSFTQLERRLARLTEQLDLQSLEILRLKKANTKLVEANRQLRDGTEASVIEASTINRSLVAELESLRAERHAEIAEMEDVLAELAPLIGSEEDHV